jgi:predicted secreted hydrolase
MSFDRRRALGALLSLVMPGRVAAQGFAGLGDTAQGFNEVLPGRPLVFPRDHGAHPDYRIEWWYLTANLSSADGRRFGAQWTLFRQASQPGAERSSWSNRNLFMAHAALTSAEEHLFAQTYARGGIGQAGVVADPFAAFIDDWSFDADGAGYSASARGRDFAYRLRLSANGLFVPHGDAGYSLKSSQGQASYYYSQPFFTVDGVVALHGAETKVSGRAWMDHEWSSRPLAQDQKGWDWFALHLASGEKLMLFRLRSAAGDYRAGTWMGADGAPHPLSGDDLVLTPLEEARVAGRAVPIRWRLEVKSRGLDVRTAPLNRQSWLATQFPYWEGPIYLEGSHAGEGYLEMTGY